MIAMLEDLVLFCVAGAIECVVTAIAAFVVSAQIVRGFVARRR